MYAIRIDIYMRFAYSWSVTASPDAESAIVRWHELVNAADVTKATRAVTDPIVVNGPKGSGPITAEEFGNWITRSGITLIPRSFHLISDNLWVVEQDATWPADKKPTRVATLFRSSEGLVSAALRFPTLHDALQFAHLYRELAATEAP